MDSGLLFNDDSEELYNRRHPLPYALNPQTVISYGGC